MGELVTIALVITIGGLLAGMAYQMRVIERLTDKIMAKDYAEYKQLEAPAPAVDLPKHKPMSWADEIPMDED